MKYSNTSVTTTISLQLRRLNRVQSVSAILTRDTFHSIIILLLCLQCFVPSVLWRCWLDGRKGIRPVKKLSGGVLAWICLEWGAELHMSQLMPLPLTVSCFSKIQIGFTFLVPSHLGSPEKGPLNGCVCVYYVIMSIWLLFGLLIDRIVLFHVLLNVVKFNFVRLNLLYLYYI